MHQRDRLACQPARQSASLRAAVSAEGDVGHAANEDAIEQRMGRMAHEKERRGQGPSLPLTRLRL